MQGTSRTSPIPSPDWAHLARQTRALFAKRRSLGVTAHRRLLHGKRLTGSSNAVLNRVKSNRVAYAAARFQQKLADRVVSARSLIETFSRCCDAIAAALPPWAASTPRYPDQCCRDSCALSRHPTEFILSRRSGFLGPSIVGWVAVWCAVRTAAGAAECAKSRSRRQGRVGLRRYDHFRLWNGGHGASDFGAGPRGPLAWVRGSALSWT